MDLKTLRKYVRFAKKNGLNRLKIGDPTGNIEFEFSELLPTTPPRRGALGIGHVEMTPLGTDERPPTEDEMLYWSTGHFDHLRSEREAAAKEKN